MVVKALLMEKHKKTALLDQILGAVGHCCLVCSILMGQNTSSDVLGHRSLQDCEAFLTLIDGVVPDWEVQFQRFRNEMQLLGSYQYCWHCGMLQDKNHNCLEPKCHKEAIRKLMMK